jgi:hypothetical protein
MVVDHKIREIPANLRLFHRLEKRPLVDHQLDSRGTVIVFVAQTSQSHNSTLPTSDPKYVCIAVACMAVSHLPIVASNELGARGI